MPARSLRRCIAAVAVGVVMVAACSTADDDDSVGADNTTGGGQSGESRTGVTADAIKIGFSYVDLETLAQSGVIKVDHGPYEQIIKVLVDDINARGGVNGRRLELVTAKYSPIGNTDQLAACTKLTEDDRVFAVLNGLIGDNNLCVTEQHSTILVNGSGINATRLDKARAPWATYGASDERSIDALVKLLDENGDLEHHTIGLYAAQAANKPLLDLGVEAVEDAGYEVTDTGFVDVPEDDTQAAGAANKVVAQRFTDKGIDTVIDVGLFIPAADFDAAGYHPRLYSVSTGNVAAAAFTNPFDKFPVVAGVGADAEPDAAMDTAEFQRCAEVWNKATGNTIESVAEENAAGKSSGNVAMQIACTTLQIFTAAAEAAGKNLDNQTWQHGLESIGKIELANTTNASFGPHKPDGQDSFQLMQHDPAWTPDTNTPEFTPIGEPITLPE
jgi:ABC-type branched-subunit amino acid transport system substrate-binding protein